MALKEAKMNLRKFMKTWLEKVSVEETDRQSEAVCQKVIESKWFRESKRLSVYVSTSGEIQTDSIIRKALEMGKEVFIPQVPQLGINQCNKACFSSPRVPKRWKWCVSLVNLHSTRSLSHSGASDSRTPLGTGTTIKTSDHSMSFWLLESLSRLMGSDVDTERATTIVSSLDILKDSRERTF